MIKEDKDQLKSHNRKREKELGGEIIMQEAEEEQTKGINHLQVEMMEGELEVECRFRADKCKFKVSLKMYQTKEEDK